MSWNAFLIIQILHLGWIFYKTLLCDHKSGIISLSKVAGDVLPKSYRKPSSSLTTIVVQNTFRFSYFHNPTEYLRVLLLPELFRIPSDSPTTRVLQNTFRFSYYRSPTKYLRFLLRPENYRILSGSLTTRVLQKIFRFS